MKYVLVFEEDQKLARLIKKGLEEQFPNISVSTAPDPYEAMNLMAFRQFDYIIADCHLQYTTTKKIFELFERDFCIDPTLNSNASREFQKINVITFSSAQPRKSVVPRSSHFKYLGHVLKRKKIEGILGDMRSFIQTPILAS